MDTTKGSDITTIAPCKLQENVYKHAYSVKFAATNEKDHFLRGLLYRKEEENEEEAYRESCGREFVFNLFPSKLNSSLGRYREDFIRLSRLVTGVRVQKLILLSELKSLSDHLNQLRDLSALCDEKLNSNERRTLALEKELLLLSTYRRSVSPKTERFNALLSVPIGWMFVCKFLCTKAASKEGSLAYPLSSEKNAEFVSLLELWLLCHSVELYSRLGEDAYKSLYHELSHCPSSTSATSGKNDNTIQNASSSRSSLSRVKFRRSVAMVSLLEGTCLLDWRQVSCLLGCPSGSFFDICNALRIYLTTLSHLSNIFSLETLRKFEVELHDLHEVDILSEPMSRALVHVTNDIASALETMLLQKMRLSSSWSKLLEELRNERVVKSGGKIIVRGNSSVEIDSLGCMTVLNDAETTVDTKILHGGMQRLDITVALHAVAESNLKTLDKRRLLQGELACLVQFGYDVSLPHIQRIWRGALGRVRLQNEMRTFVFLTMHTAAVVIQSKVRGARLKYSYSRRRHALQKQQSYSRIILMQKVVRGWLQAKHYKRIKANKLFRLKIRAAILFQALFRGFLSRRQRKGALESLDRRCCAINRNWAAISIQSIARGYIDRKTIIRSLRIRRQLNPKLLRLTEKYLTQGDLWSFLRQIGEEMQLKDAEVAII